MEMPFLHNQQCLSQSTIKFYLLNFNYYICTKKHRGAVLWSNEDWPPVSDGQCQNRLCNFCLSLVPLSYVISYLNTCNWKFSPWQKCGLLLNKASSMWALTGRYHHQENGKELDLQAGVDWVLLCQGLSSEYFLAKSWHHWRSLGGQYQQRWSCSLHPPGQREQLRSALYSWKTGFLKSFKSNTLKIALANEELLRTIPIKWCFKFAEL